MDDNAAPSISQMQPQTQAQQQAWPMAARIAAFAAGTMMVARGTRHPSLPGIALGLLGAALMTRAATNRSWRDLLGLDAIPPRTPEHLDQRMEARAQKPEDKLPTYQELLDDAVENTFPASDPIAPNAARNTAHRVSTAVDSKDWKLKPAETHPPRGREVVAEFDDEASARRAQDEALASELPTARLALPPGDHAEGPAATLTIVACDDAQRQRAEEIVRKAGAAHVELRAQ